MSQPFAVFDIDGTLIRWQLYHALGDAFVRQGIIDKSEFEVVKTSRMNWKKRSHPLSYSDYEATLIDVIDSAMTGLRLSDLEKACNQVFDEYKDQVYTYTRDLIRELKSQNYMLFAISASHSTLVKMIAEHYGFDDYAGTEYTIKQGKFTGEKDVMKQERKIERLNELIASHNCTSKDSVGVGDSEGDIPMLEAVEKAIAFNPTKSLFEYATKHDWRVVVERKNMIYRLEPNNGSFLLA